MVQIDDIAKKNLLVSLADKNYIEQAKQLFSSVYWNAGWDGDYMLLASDIPEHELLWFKRKRILIKNCNLLLSSNWGEDKEFSPIIANKFYLFTEAFKKWQKIVFLDADIIVKASLDKLLRVNYFGAVRNYYFDSIHAELYNPERFILFHSHLKLNAPSLNAGVFVFNTNLITKDTYKVLLNLLNNNINDFRFGEQTALNFFFYKKWVKLPYIYNTFINYYNFKTPSYIKKIVIHFANKKKPLLWEKDNLYFKEWEKNLLRAEYINLSVVQKAKKMSFFKIYFYSTLLETHIRVYLINAKIKKRLYIFFDYIEKMIRSFIYF